MLFRVLLVPGLNFSLVVKHFSGLASLHLDMRTITPLPLCGMTSFCQWVWNDISHQASAESKSSVGT